MVPSTQESQASGPKGSHTTPSDLLINLGRSLGGTPSNRERTSRLNPSHPLHPKEEHHAGSHR
jgi:hypothetical protein